MPADLNDIHSRLSVAETEIKSAKQTIDNLERNFHSISQGLFEIRDIMSRQTTAVPMITEKLEKLSEFVVYNMTKSDTARDKILTKVESLETGFNTHLTVNAVTNMKVKIMWGIIVFLLSTAGVLLTQVLKNQIP